MKGILQMELGRFQVEGSINFAALEEAKAGPITIAAKHCVIGATHMN